MKSLRLASLFCGCGGTDVGFSGGFEFLGKKFKRHPISLVYANDIDSRAASILEDNFRQTVDTRSITDIAASEIPDHDILTGGFPCQSFSIIAQNPRRLGIKSENGQLFFEMCRILRKKRPKCFVAENVKGLLSANRGEAFPLIMEEFRKCGYYVIHLLLNSYHYGAPQKRQRVFIIGFKEQLHLERFRPPTPCDNFNVLKSVLIPESSIEEKYFFSTRAVLGLSKAKKEMNKGRIQNPEEPCGTVGAHLAKVSLNSTDPVLKLNGRYRRFTPREVARIQSFPDSFALNSSDAILYRALGNAISPVVAWHVADSIVRAIRSNQ